MKLTRMFMGLLGALALTGCSSEEIVPDQKPIEGEGKTRYMSVTVCSVLPGTRADDNPEKPGGSQTTIGSDNENGNGTYEVGYGAENKIKSLRFYFFDNNGNPVAMYGTQNFYDCKDTDIDNDNTSSDMGSTIEKKLNAIIIIKSSDPEVSTKIKKMVAFANIGNLNLGNDNKSLSQLKAIVKSETECNMDNLFGESSQGFLMTSSSYISGKETENGTTFTCEVDIEDGAVKESEELAKANPIEVYVERVAAKVRVKAEWDKVNVYTGANDIKNVSYGGKTYQAIALYKKPTTSDITAGRKKGDAITIEENGAQKQIYVILKGWNLWWTAQKSYLIKNIRNYGSGADGMLGGSWWNGDTYFRSYWAENPSGVGGQGTDKGLNNFTHSYANKPIVTTSFTETNLATEVAYCLENAGDKGGETPYLKYSYNPDSETTNRTLVYLAGDFVTLDDATKETPVATKLELMQWASYLGTKDDVKKSMFASIQNKVFVKSASPVESGTTTDGDNQIITDNYMMYALTVDNRH